MNTFDVQIHCDIWNIETDTKYRRFPDNIFKCISLAMMYYFIGIVLKFVPEHSGDNEPALVN